jgi:excisionase family DNA binding protein
MESLNGSGKQFPKVQRSEDQFGVDRPVNDRIESLRDIDALCRLLGVPKKTVYKWTSDRHSGIPFYKVGRHLRFRFSEVDSWLRKYRASEAVREFSPAALRIESRQDHQCRLI